MKKFIFLMILLSQIHWFSYAQNDRIFDNENLSLNLFLNFMLFEKSGNPGAMILGSIITSSVSIGAGWHFNIIPHVFSPGIYGEGGISLLSLLLNNNGNDKDDDDAFFETAENDNSLMGFLGIRLYNQFSFSVVKIQPFFGLNLTGAYSKSSRGSIGFYDFGIMTAIKKFGMEYGCYIPLKEKEKIKSGIMHRVSFGFHF